MSNDLDVALEILEDKALVALQGRDVCILFIYVNIKKKQQKNKHTPMRFIECSLSSKKRKQNISINISVFGLLSAIHTAVFALKITHQSQYLSNCAPTPPLIQH